MGRRAFLVVTVALVALLTVTLWSRAAILDSSSDELLARTDVLAEFFDGTLTSLALGARMLENDPDLHAMNDLALAIPLLRSVAVYDESGLLIRAVPPGLFPPDHRLDRTLIRRHMEEWEEIVVSADVAATRLQLSRVIEENNTGVLQIAVLTTSIASTLARLPETLDAPVYSAALVDLDGVEFFHYFSSGTVEHAERCVVAEVDLEGIAPQSRILGVGVRDQIVAGKQLTDFPLRLILTFDKSVVLEPWQRSTVVYSAVTLGLIATIIAVGLKLKQQSERRASMEHQVESLSTDILNVSDRLEAARGELSDLAYVVAHDLKAPLRGISQLAGWLVQDQAERLDDEGQSMLGMLQERVARMNAMIEGILTYSRVNRDALEPELVNVQKLIETTVEEIALPECVTVSIAPDLPTVYGDPGQLRRLFQNLIDNAARVVTPSRGTVRIGSETTDPQAWIIKVADDGPGVDPKHHDAIFRPLHTVEGTASEHGTGMGLAMCRKIATRHGGSLGVTSALGAGTVMTVRLPKEKEHEQ
jgi:signal transduction histidine kinase